MSKHILVTGAGSGLGLGFAERYLRRGHRVSVLDRDLPDSACQRLDRAGAGRWTSHLTDVTDDAGVNAAVTAAVAACGAPDLVIHCAGIVLNRAVADMQGSDFRRVIDVNLNGSFHVASAVLRHMKPGSRLALIASMAGITSNYAYAAYGASKFGVVGLASTLRYEYAPRGIAISCICPPEVRTPMVAGERTPGNYNEVAMALKDYAGSLDADVAIDAMMAGLDAGEWMIIPGLQAKAVALFSRHLPKPFFAVMEFMVGRELRKRGQI